MTDTDVDSETGRPLIERDVLFKRGASFFDKDGVTMFQFVIDSASILGPRKANKLDREQYVLEWKAYNEGRLTQLDHDGDGIPGGSAPAVEESPEEPVKRGPGRPKKVP